MLRIISTIIVALCIITTTKAQTDSIYMVPEEMPYPIECEGVEDTDQCRNETILKFIYANIYIPTVQRGEYFDALVVLSFIIDQNGEMKDVAILRDPGKTFSDDAKRVVELMGKEMEWVAGKENGNPVSTKILIPIKYKSQ